MTRGVEFKMGWRWLVDGLPKDLTNFSILVQIRPYDKSNQVIAAYDRASANLVIDDANGLINLNIHPSQTLAFTFKTAFIDCWIVNAADTDGERSPMYKITLDWGVSRA